MKLTKQIIVIGDSHTRSFAESDYFLPIFMGSGKVHNFINEHFAQFTEKKLLNTMSRFSKDDNFMLVFGEPDCRWNTYNSWQKPLIPIKGGPVKISDSLARFKSSILKIRKLYHNLIIYNANPHERIEGNETALTWNKEVAIFCKNHDILFCDIYDKILNDLNSFLIRRPPEEKEDYVHLNKSVQQLVIQELNITETPKKIAIPSSSFVLDDRFKCFYFQDLKQAYTRLLKRARKELMADLKGSSLRRARNQNK